MVIFGISDHKGKRQIMGSLFDGPEKWSNLGQKCPKSACFGKKSTFLAFFHFWDRDFPLFEALFGVFVFLKSEKTGFN